MLKVRVTHEGEVIDHGPGPFRWSERDLHGEILDAMTDKPERFIHDSVYLPGE